MTPARKMTLAVLVLAVESHVLNQLLKVISYTSIWEFMEGLFNDLLSLRGGMICFPNSCAPTPTQWSIYSFTWRLIWRSELLTLSFHQPPQKKRFKGFEKTSRTFRRLHTLRSDQIKCRSCEICAATHKQWVLIFSKGPLA